MFGNLDHGKDRLALEKDSIHLFERPSGGLGIEEIHAGEYECVTAFLSSCDESGKTLTYITAKTTYVLYPMLLKATGVTMTMTKFHNQLPVVDMAFAGARIFKGTISAGYNQVIPNQPTVIILAICIRRIFRQTYWQRMC